MSKSAQTDNPKTGAQVNISKTASTSIHWLQKARGSNPY